MKYWQAIKHVCEHPEDKAVADGWWIGIDRDGDLIHRRASGSVAHRYILPVVRNADWQIESAWTECGQETALDKLQEGGYLVETRVHCDWQRVRLDRHVCRVGCADLIVSTDRQWRYRKVTG